MYVLVAVNLLHIMDICMYVSLLAINYWEIHHVDENGTHIRAHIFKFYREDFIICSNTWPLILVWIKCISSYHFVIESNSLEKYEK